MDLTANASAVLRERYLGRGQDGEVVESPEQLFRRVADAVARAEASWGATASRVQQVADRFFRMMTSFQFLPNSPTLMNAGRDVGQLAACFVVPVQPSSDGIDRAIEWAERIQKTGGGTGFSFSQITRSAATGNRGPVDVIGDFDRATETVRQVGVRRGANMGVLRVDHPDILEFIGAKLSGSALRNFNLSVAVSDAFMAAVEAGSSYELIRPEDAAPCGQLDARGVFDAMVEAAWSCGDPGLLFMDRIQARQPTPALGSIEATNPCGEQPLLPFESCTLGSINLARFVAQNDLNWDRLRQVVHDAVRFLDDVVEVNRYPLAEIEQATRATRKIGLGVMGWADCLVELGIPYSEPLALALAQRVAAFIDDESVAASVALAETRGAFPAFSGSRWSTGELGAGRRPMRNATTTTVAPTGTIAIIAGCSSGIEPLYALAYGRRALDGQILQEVHSGFVRRAQGERLWTSQLQAVIRNTGRVGDLRQLPADFRELFATAHELDVNAHLRMQAQFQKHVHAAVSKTINLKADATTGVVAHAYRLAYELGCKGVTIYRDGSKSEQVLAAGAGADSSSCPGCGAEAADSASCRVCSRCGLARCG